jgi:hypothetical protein
MQTQADLGVLKSEMRHKYARAGVSALENVAAGSVNADAGGSWGAEIRDAS